MKLEIILALVLVTTSCSTHSIPERETETDVEEPTNEGGTAAVEPREKSVAHDLPVAFPKQLQYEDDKRGGMDFPFFAPEVCKGWIEDFYDEYLVLSEDRSAVFSDLQRFFIFMDDDGDGKISAEEFNPKWMDATGFSEPDATALFYTFFTLVGDPADQVHIVPRNVEGIWEDIFMTDIDGGELSKESFSETWQDIILPALPSHGCSVVNEGTEDGDHMGLTREDAVVRPDVYGYFKRKRK